MGDVARCVFDLTDCAIEAGDPAQMSFAVCGAAGDLVLQAADLVDMTRWIKELAKGIEIGRRERERQPRRFGALKRVPVGVSASREGETFPVTT